MTALLQKNAPLFRAKLRVLTGPLKGKSFKLISEQIYIGRTSEFNDIVLDDDPYCSRKHTVISKDPVSGKYYVSRIAPSAHLYVNKKTVESKSLLKDRDVLTVGQTQFKLEVLKKSELALLPPASQESKNPKPLSSKKKKPVSLPRLIIIFLVLGGLFFFLSESDTNSQKSEKPTLKSQQDFEEEIESIESMEKTIKEEKSYLKNPSYKNAHQAYLKGIRDFRQGLFGRARENFRVCKTLYPQHKLCTGYLKKSQIKYEQLAQRHLVLGKQYREKKQYRQCVSSFKTVMTMMAYNYKHPLYQTAKSNLDFCSLNIKSRY